MNWYAEQPILLLQRRPRTPHPFLSTGSASGSTTRTSMGWATSCVTTVWGFSSTTPLVSSSWLTESKSIFRSLHQRESLCSKTSLNIAWIFFLIKLTESLICYVSKSLLLPLFDAVQCMYVFIVETMWLSVIPTIFILFFLLLIVHGIFPLCLLLYGLYIDFPFRNIQYIERDGTEHYHTLKVFPETLTKKVTLLKYFRNYMNEHLLKVNIILCGFPK